MSFEDQQKFLLKYFNVTHPYDIFGALHKRQFYSTSELKKLNDIRFNCETMGDKYHKLYIGMIYSKIKQLEDDTI